MVAMSTAPLFPLLYAPKHLPYEDIVWMRYLWLPVYTAAACYSVWHFRALLRSAPAVIPTALLLVFAARAPHGRSPRTSPCGGGGLGFNGLMAFYLAARFSWRALVEILACAILILALGSYVMCLGLPHIGIHSEAQCRRLAGAVAGEERTRLHHGDRSPGLGGLRVAAAGTPATVGRFGSALRDPGDPVANRAPVCSAWWAASAPPGPGHGAPRPTLAIGVAFLAGCALLALVFTAVLDLPLVLSLLGKEPTLTGRTDVWAAVSHRIAERPMFGYGYGRLLVRHVRPGPAGARGSQVGGPLGAQWFGLRCCCRSAWIGTVMASPTALSRSPRCCGASSRARTASGR